MEAELLTLGPGQVIVDLSGVSFLGSSGLQVLFTLAQRCERLVVVAPFQAPFRRALGVAELGRVATIVDTVAEALKDCAQP